MTPETDRHPKIKPSVHFKLHKRLNADTLLLGVVLGLLSVAAILHAQELDDLKRFIGKNDSILVADAKGHIVLAKNADEKRIPASILKIFTSLVALHYLG